MINQYTIYDPEEMKTLKEDYELLVAVHKVQMKSMKPDHLVLRYADVIDVEFIKGDGWTSKATVLDNTFLDHIYTKDLVCFLSYPRNRSDRLGPTTLE